MPGRLLVVTLLVWSNFALAGQTSDTTGRMAWTARVFVAPGLLLRRVAAPPSISRLLGPAWLKGRDPMTLAAMSNAVVYGHLLAPAQLDTALAGVHSL